MKRPYSQIAIALAACFHWLACSQLADAQAAQVHKDQRFNSVAWMQNAFEYRLLTKQTYRYALTQLKAGLDDKDWSADEVQSREGGFSDKPAAIILDVDETVFDNSHFNARNILEAKQFNYATWNAWCKEEKASAVPGAVEFLEKAESLGVKTYFVTNRDDVIKSATINNLKHHGINATNDNVLTRNDREGRGDDKVSRRAMVAEDHRIVLLIGDSMSDLCSGMGTGNQLQRNAKAALKMKWLGDRWIMLPNPAYGGWERALPAGGSALRAK
jgi:acid phosphatase